MSVADRVGATGRSRSVAPSRPAPPAAEQPPPQVGVVLAALLASLVLAGLTFVTAGWVMFTLFLIGLALGLVLFHSRFGFTSAWRQLVSVGQGKALRAHMLMLAVACTLFAPLLAGGVSLSGEPTMGFVSPLGSGVVIGAFLFGVGMQLGGSCASGTLFAIGSGQTSILITLGGFIAGSVLGAYHFQFWAESMPTGPAVSLATSTPLGYAGAWAVSLAVMAAIAGITVVVGRRRNPPPVEHPPSARGVARALRGSWPLWAGGVLLAGLNALTLAVSGQGWGVTSAFALWGSKWLSWFGVDVASWPYWQQELNAPKLEASVLLDKTSVMDFGVILGAMVASAAAGAFIVHRRIPGRLALGAVIGGVLMGYGARIAFGCNIGAYFGGISSFSLHGWLWGAMALLGTFAGLRLRPLFGLTNPKPVDSVC
ncbi:YeeE/YedE family protein [Nocardioides iriomotensis]|uniref:YeeE/YedE family protein n=1 Tax=Nocardioides iriomotensis TaxID=715784 RepID=A0A4Q5J1Z1_9ACTN|nr:YeeE/YedE family protein [Nocardioides iriomotensis]RYU12373.1 YeeE/YedE family protein [Nocardioides iriomotensis]